MDTNWELIKFQYEILGSSVEDLAAEHEVSATVLEYNAKSWKRIPLAEQKALDIKDLTSLDSITKEVVQHVREQARASSLLKQKFLGPKYIALEAMLLTKANLVLASLDPKEKGAANSIKTISSVLKELLEQNYLLSADAEREELSDASAPTEWTIRIVEPEADEQSEPTSTD
jgi:hypothetical protein